MTASRPRNQCLQALQGLASTRASPFSFSSESVCFSKEFAKRGSPDKNGRFATRVFKTIDRTGFATLKKELVLRTMNGMTHQLKALLRLTIGRPTPCI